MQAIDIVTREDLTSLYGKQIPFIYNNGSQITDRTISDSHLTEDSFPVKVLKDVGSVYKVVSFKHKTNNGDHLILPAAFVKRVNIPDAIDGYAPTLDLYHKDHWYFDKINNKLYIHYPEITIKNSLGQSHNITDLIISLPISPSYHLSGGFYGFRLSYTERELAIGYIHSHSHTRAYYFDSYCLGENNGWSRYVSSISGNRFITPNEFGLFLSQLKNYLSWESIEGTPHISIKSLTTTSFTEQFNTDSPTDHQPEEWDDFIIRSTLNLVDNYKPLLSISYQGWQFSPRISPGVALSFELDCIRKFADLCGLDDYCLKNYSMENNGYLNLEANNSDYSISTVRSKMSETISGSNLQPFLTKLGFGEVEFPIVNKAATTGTSVPTVKRFSTTVSTQFIVSINEKLLNGFKPSNERNNS